MAENLKAASFSAGLSPNEKKKVDDFGKSLTVHRELLNLPPDVATTVYNNKPANQKKILVNNYGTEDPATKPSRGWLGTAGFCRQWRVDFPAVESSWFPSTPCK